MSMTVGELVSYHKLDDSHFTRTLDTDERKFHSFGSRMGRVSGMVGKAAMAATVGGVAALGAGLVAGAYAGIKYNSTIEQTTIAMGTMLGSTKKAKALIADVSKMAAETPFEFPELADTSKRLVAYGFAQKDIIDTTTRLGDISSALNIPLGDMADLYGKARVQGRLYSEDVMQFAGRGVPIFKALADVMGVQQSEVKGLVEEGKVGFPELEKAIGSLTDKGSMFGGMMAKQSKSFGGQLSTLKDGVVQLMGSAFKPLFTWLTKEGMPALNKAMPSIQKAVEGVVDWVGGLFDSIGPVLGAIIGWFKKHGPAIIGIVKRMAAIWGDSLKPAIKQIEPLFRDLGETVAVWVQFIRDHWDTIGPAVKLVCDIIGRAFSILLRAVRVILALLRGDWDEAWKQIKGILSSAVRQLQDTVKLGGKLMRMALDAAWTLIKRAVGAAMDWIVDRIAGAWHAVEDKTASIWDGILRKVAGYVNKVIDFINPLPGIDIKHVSWGSGSGKSSSTTKAHGNTNQGDPSGGWDAQLGNGPAGDPSGKGGGSYGDSDMPGAPSLPAPFAGMLPAIGKAVWSKIKSLIGSVLSGLGGSGYGWATTLAKRFGLSVTSTYRKGAITAAGYPSDHGVWGRAADIAGPASMMSNLWSYLKRTAGSWKQAIYGHQIINRGSLGYYAPSDHFDHVHVARSYSPPGGSGKVGDDSRSYGPPGASERAFGPGAQVYLSFDGAIFVDSTRAGVERIWRLVTNAENVVAVDKGRLSPT
jgi:tape measure domain-containing protein